jgi:rhodanese-related sulfurtransferase
MNISSTALKLMLSEKGTKPFLLDVRTKEEHHEFNIGGLNIPLRELPQNLKTLEPYKSETIVVYCRGGARSAIAQSMLQSHGFEKVFNLSGGVSNW